MSRNIVVILHPLLKVRGLGLQNPKETIEQFLNFGKEEGLFDPTRLIRLHIQTDQNPSSAWFQSTCRYERVNVPTITGEKITIEKNQRGRSFWRSGERLTVDGVHVSSLFSYAFQTKSGKIHEHLISHKNMKIMFMYEVDDSADMIDFSTNEESQRCFLVSLSFLDGEKQVFVNDLKTLSYHETREAIFSLINSEVQATSDMPVPKITMSESVLKTFPLPSERNEYQDSLMKLLKCFNETEGKHMKRVFSSLLQLPPVTVFKYCLDNFERVSIKSNESVRLLRVSNSNILEVLNNSRPSGCKWTELEPNGVGICVDILITIINADQSFTEYIFDVERDRLYTWKNDVCVELPRSAAANAKGDAGDEMMPNRNSKKPTPPLSSRLMHDVKKEVLENDDEYSMAFGAAEKTLNQLNADVSGDDVIFVDEQQSFRSSEHADDSFETFQPIGTVDQKSDDSDDDDDSNIRLKQAKMGSSDDESSGEDDGPLKDKSLETVDGEADVEKEETEKEFITETDDAVGGGGTVEREEKQNEQKTADERIDDVDFGDSGSKIAEAGAEKEETQKRKMDGIEEGPVSKKKKMDAFPKSTKSIPVQEYAKILFRGCLLRSIDHGKIEKIKGQTLERLFDTSWSTKPSLFIDSGDDSWPPRRAIVLESNHRTYLLKQQQRDITQDFDVKVDCFELNDRDFEEIWCVTSDIDGIADAPKVSLELVPAYIVQFVMNLHLKDSTKAEAKFTEFQDMELLVDFFSASVNSAFKKTLHDLSSQRTLYWKELYNKDLVPDMGESKAGMWPLLVFLMAPKTQQQIRQMKAMSIHVPTSNRMYERIYRASRMDDEATEECLQKRAAKELDYVEFGLRINAIGKWKNVESAKTVPGDDELGESSGDYEGVNVNEEIGKVKTPVVVADGKKKEVKEKKQKEEQVNFKVIDSIDDIDEIGTKWLVINDEKVSCTFSNQRTHRISNPMSLRLPSPAVLKAKNVTVLIIKPQGHSLTLLNQWPKSLMFAGTLSGKVLGETGSCHFIMVGADVDLGSITLRAFRDGCANLIKVFNQVTGVNNSTTKAHHPIHYFSSGFDFGK